MSPGAEGPAEALDLALAGRIERRLELDVERTGARAAPVHRAQHLDVAHRVESEAARDAGLHQFDDPRHCRLRVLGRHEIEVVLALGAAHQQSRVSSVHDERTSPQRD